MEEIKEEKLSYKARSRRRKRKHNRMKKKKQQEQNNKKITAEDILTLKDHFDRMYGRKDDEK